MAAAADPDEVLRSTDGKANFQRLARLLISGGTSLLRETFDSIHPPSNLPTILRNPATKKQLTTAKLTKPQWDSLYPSPRVYGKSTDFDVTLLFRLIRTICNLAPPPTGWDALPVSTDHSLTADLVRIKYYRNSVYGHASQKMEIPDEQFLTLWREISEALARIAGQISPTKEKEWQRVINNYFKSPLTPEDERNVQELEEWYRKDIDVKKRINQLETTVRDEHQDTRKELNNATQVLHGEARDIKDQLREVQQSMSQSTGAVLRLLIDADIGPEGGAAATVTTPQYDPVRGAKAVSNHQQAAGLRDGNVGVEGIPSAQDVLNFIAFKYFQSVDPLKPEELNGFVEYLVRVRNALIVRTLTGSLVIIVECSSLQILEELWKDYCTGRLNRMAQKFLVGEYFREKFGLAVKLTTTIVEEEYRACRKKLSATDSLALGEKVSEQFEQLRRRREKLHDAFLRWIPIRTRTKEQLHELAKNLDDHHRNVTKATITGASMGTVGGILAMAGLITAPFTFGAGLIVSLVGAGIGGAGGLVMSGSKAVQLIMEKSGLKEVQAAIDEDREACIQVQDQLDSLENLISSLTEFLKPLRDDALLLRELEGSGFEFFLTHIFCEDIGSSNKEKVEFCARFFRGATSAATISASAATTAGGVARSAALAGTRAAHFAGSAIGVALLPLDIALLVKSSLDLYRGSTSAAVKDIRRILNELECPDKEEIQGLVESFIVEKFTEAIKKGQIKKDYQ